MAAADPAAYAAALIRRLDEAHAHVDGPGADTIRAAVLRQREELQFFTTPRSDTDGALLPAGPQRIGNPTDQVAALAQAYAFAAAATRDAPGPLAALFDEFGREIEAIVAGA